MCRLYTQAYTVFTGVIINMAELLGKIFERKYYFIKKKDYHMK